MASEGGGGGSPAGGPRRPAASSALVLAPAARNGGCCQSELWLDRAAGAQHHELRFRFFQASRAAWEAAVGRREDLGRRR